MKFFPNPEKAAEKKLADTRVARGALAVRLAAAQDAVASARATLHQLAVEGAVDAALADGEAKLRDTERRVATLTPALVEIDKLLATLEAERAEMLDKKTRVATSAATLALADELTELAAAYHASTSALHEICGRVLAVTPEVLLLESFAASSLIEVSVAIPVIAEALRQHARAVTNNLAPAAMPKVPEPPAKPVAAAPKAPTVRVFSTRPIKWLDQDGKQVSGGKCVDIDLPVAVAERALASGACVKLDHPTRAGNLGRWPGNYSLAVCFDLDSSEAAVPGPQETIVHSAFTPIDRGKPFTLKIAGAAQ
jgi:hypothetical protein